MSTASDNITLNLGSGGPVVHTDYISGTGHVQYVKLDIGGLDATSPITSTNALPVQVYGLKSNWTTIPVGGGTNGQAIPVSGTINVGEVSITGGTIDKVLGASCDIRTVASGVTFGIMNAGSDEIAVTLDSVNINSIALPGGITTGTLKVDNNSGTLPAYACTAGVKIKNMLKTAELAGGGILGIGASAAGFAHGTTAAKYLLYPGEEVFLEVSNINTIRATSITMDGDGNAIMSFQAS
tara:strand:+ start:389 stop:1105 length:717 start_codon:yes stop_codon:yes gene_type:complete